MLDFAFLKNEAGEREGLGDAGIETFTDDPYASCAREAGQNSRDAERALPVRMSFDVLEISAAEFPGHDTLQRTVASCLDAARDEKTVDFFTQAQAILEKPEIPVLRIADSNTGGLKGPPDDEGTPFNSLVKATGVSEKESDTSGGSFGIGKNASFAVSDLRTVFYSTVYEGEPGRAFYAAQGKARLVSHTDHDGTKRRATGYWGRIDGHGAVTNTEDAPEWLHREEIGTSIFATGFRKSDDWASRIAYSVLCNFFVAVHEGEMEFEVDGGALCVNRNTIAALFVHPDIRAAAEEASQLAQLELSAQFYECWTSALSSVEEFEVPGLGVMELRVLVGEGLPKRVGIVRNGMLITTSLEHFGSPLERFRGARDFAAVLTPKSDSARRTFKALENPRHNSLSAHRISDPMKRLSAEIDMKQLLRQLRDRISERTAQPAEDEAGIDELASFFAEAGGGDRPPDPFADKDLETHVYEAPQQRARRTLHVSAGAGKDGGKGQRGAGTRQERTRNGPGRGAGEGGEGTRGRSAPMRIEGFRNVVVSDSGSRQRSIWFTPSATGAASLKLEATGINVSEPLRVIAADSGSVTDGAIRLDLVEGQRVKLQLTFDSPYAGPLEPVAMLLVESAA